MKNNKKALIFLVIALISFSSYEVVSKTVIGAINPSQLTFIRFLIGGIFLLPFSILDIKKRKIKIEKSDWIRMILLGILNVAISMNLIQIGYKYTNANLSAIIISANPIVVACFSSFLLKEGLSWKKITGLIIGIAGVLVAVGGTGDLSQPGILFGIILQVIGMFAFGLYTVLGKKTSIKLGSQTMTAFTDLFGAIAILPFVMIAGIHPFVFDLSSIWVQMIYICIGNTGIAFYLYFRALEDLDTSLGSMTFFIKPMLACIIAAVFLGEKFSIQIVFGIIFVAIGIYLVLKATKKEAMIVKKNN